MLLCRSTKKIIHFIKNNSDFFKKDFAYSDNYLPLAFLCGKRRSNNDNRSIIQKDIFDVYNILCLYSEELFEIFSREDLDLMTFEEFLFDVSSAIVLIVESFGSACELGSFGLINTNIGKLWVINNKKYKDENSYIEKGPLKKIKKLRPGHVFYENFNDDGQIELSTDLYVSLSKLDQTNFRRKPYTTVGSTVDITDAGYLLWFLIDYVNIFGSILENEFIPIIKNIFNVEQIRMTFSSKNNADGAYEWMSEWIISNLPQILVKLEVFFEKYNPKYGKYFSLNHGYFRKINRSATTLPSIIFKSSFIKTQKSRKELSKIICSKKKEGFDIWKI
ncbi:MAG: retron St85 family effector protein [Desulfobacterales bacterium]|jgi:hypothetical protein|nr:retron St85 family effector protein [Bacilli bacterium]MDY0377390.1 retron St85 family effector protein [Desulfobacterales bacterium]